MTEQNGRPLQDVERKYYTFEELQECADNDFVHLNAIKLARTPPHEIGAWLERLSHDDREKVLKKLSVDNTTEVLAEMDADDSADILSEMRDSQAVRILTSLAPDDAAEMMRELDEDDLQRLLSKMPDNTANTLRHLLTYDPNTAGGVMTPHFVSLRTNMTVDEAITYIRASRNFAENIECLYVVDDTRHLVGVLNIQKLLWTHSHVLIGSIMNPEVEGICTPEQDKETVAQSMAHNRFNTLPVVDGQRRLIGIITHDDVIDILRQEATEDIQKLHGAGGDENIHDTVLYSIRKRVPWLIVNLLIAFLTSGVISLFENKIAQLTILAVFMTMISGLGGNSGAQTLAISIRSLALGEYHIGDTKRILLKETIKCICSGIIVGTIAACITGLWAHDVRVAWVVFISMVLNMGLSGLAGAFIPMFLTRIKCDPAQSSYIFLTSITDIAGMFIFLGIGSYFLL